MGDTLRNIYASIDIGSDNIKVVVCELYKGRYNLLAASSVKSQGIKKGLISNVDLAKKCIEDAFLEVEEMLGFKITKVMAIVPSYFADFTMIKGEIEIKHEDLVITGEDVIDVLQAAMQNSIVPTKEMVTIMPIDFEVDSGICKEPQGLVSKTMKTRAIMVTVPKKNIYSVVSILSSLGVTPVDISLGCIAVKNNLISMGSHDVDNDISYMYKVAQDVACDLKETFAVSYRNRASTNEFREVVNKKGEKLKINQYELSEIVQARLEEIFTLAQSEITNLTKKSLDYIIITGGITNMPNFKELASQTFGNSVIIGNVNLIGLRNNKYSQVIGNIIYFVNKLKLKGKTYSMISSDDMEVLSSVKKSSNDTSKLGKVFGYFFGE